MPTTNEPGGRIHPVVLSGGAGTRLWPISRALYPKQLMRLTSDATMFQDTVRRVADGNRFAPPLIVCNEAHRFIIGEQLREIDVSPQAILLEPAGRNTAPAAAVAALWLGGGDQMMLLLPSDHVVGDRNSFITSVDIATSAARSGALVTFGVTPRRPETGFGYVQRGDAAEGHEGAFHVRRFVEKPDAGTAKKYVKSGEYYWNSGMFLFSAATYLAELERLQPQMVAACRASLEGAAEDLDFVRLGAESFVQAPADSIDYAIMEHTKGAMVVPLESGWSDVGSWAALWEIGEKDDNANLVSGTVIAQDVHDSYIRADGPMVAALGLDDVVIVTTEDAVLVAAKGRVQDVKRLVEALETAGQSVVTTHRMVYRPWGSYQTIDAGERFQVKRITVNPGGVLSLQKHRHRAEHWVIVNGTAQVTRGEDRLELRENESIYIPAGTVHRLENAGRSPLHLIEVQSGSYLGEDDIVRLEDKYGRR